jgi:Glycosyl hydrolase family 30 beta sandwich domain
MFATLNLGHVAAENPGGQKVLILTNTGSARAIQVNQGSKSAAVPMKENSIAALVWT